MHGKTQRYWLRAAGYGLVLGVAMTTVLVTAEERDRAKVPETYKWNLGDLFPSQAEWRERKEKITAEIPRLCDFQGKLASSPSTLADALEMMSRIDKELSRLYSYASMLSDEDTRI